MLADPGFRACLCLSLFHYAVTWCQCKGHRGLAFKYSVLSHHPILYLLTMGSELGPSPRLRTFQWTFVWSSSLYFLSRSYGRSVQSVTICVLGSRLLQNYSRFYFQQLYSFLFFSSKNFWFMGPIQIDIMTQSDAIVQYFKMKYISDILKLHSPPRLWHVNDLHARRWFPRDLEIRQHTSLVSHWSMSSVCGHSLSKLNSF